MEFDSLSMLKTSLWVQVVAHLAIFGTAVFYLGHLEKHLHFHSPEMMLPGSTLFVIRWRSALWLVPVAFGAIATRLSFRSSIDPPTVSVFTAFSILADVCVIALAVLVTCFPFGYPMILNPKT